MTSRSITSDDRDLLATSLASDQYHKETIPAFFYAEGTMCNVYEDGQGPVLFCRGTKSLRLDIQFINNNDFERNRQVMLDGFPDLVEKAKAAGFTELVFNTASPLLKRFCTHQLKFVVVDGHELRKFI